MTFWPTDKAACVGLFCSLNDNCQRHHGHLLASQRSQGQQAYVRLEDGEPCQHFLALEQLSLPGLGG